MHHQIMIEKKELLRHLRKVMVLCVCDNLICKENRKESKMRPMRRKRKRMNQYLESSDGYSTDNALNTNNAHVLKRKRRRLNVTRNVPKQKMKNQWKKKENKIRDQRNRIEELEAKMDQLLSEKKKRYYKKKGAQSEGIVYLFKQSAVHRIVLGLIVA
eukprot:559939_1